MKKSKISTKQSEILKMNEIKIEATLTRELKVDGVTVSFLDSDKLRQKIAERVYRYFAEHEVWSGEQIQQSDEPIIDAPILLSDIADNVMNFSVQYDED